MINKKLTLIVVIQTILIIFLFWILVHFAKDEYHAFNQGQEEEIETPDRVAIKNGATVVNLSPDAQLQSEITTSSISRLAHASVLNTLGNVMNIDTLIELRTRFINAKANANVARAALASSMQEFKRMQQLNQDNKNISDQALLKVEAIYKSDQAKLNAAEIEAKNLRDTMRQTWGDALADSATRETSHENFNKLLSHQYVLIMVSYPVDAAKPKANQTIHVYPTGSSMQPIKATFFSEAPLANQTIQGVTYYFTAPANQLRAGMRLTIQITEASQKTNIANKNENGVLIPNSAVVWYGGKAWVYKKIDADNFMRLPINTDNPTEDGWYSQSKQITAKDELVTKGAQLLLSEEFKYQIKNENED
jgi:membrane fusion protein, multidrug efflux system